jgi:glutathione S-transferase
MELVVGTDSTWSLRAWMCFQITCIDINVKVIDLTLKDYKTELYNYSPTGLVPALINGSTVIHDSLAIAEYVNEISKGQLYPVDTEQRAVARSLCAELHTGFFQLRNNCPFTLDEVTISLNKDEKILSELNRIEAIFSQAKLPFMYDSAGVVDTFYAVLAFRLNTYGIKFEGSAGRYQESLLSWNILENAIIQAMSWRNK